MRVQETRGGHTVNRPVCWLTQKLSGDKELEFGSLTDDSFRIWAIEIGENGIKSNGFRKNVHNAGFNILPEDNLDNLKKIIDGEDVTLTEFMPYSTLEWMQVIAVRTGTVFTRYASFTSTYCLPK